MAHARGVSSKIWRSVVMAGAMLGSQACGGGAKKPAPAAPSSEAAKPTPTESAPAAAEGVAAEPAVAPTTPEPAAAAPDPCAGMPAQADTKTETQAADKPAADSKTKKKKRPRGSGDKPVGRGFVLA